MLFKYYKFNFSLTYLNRWSEFSQKWGLPKRTSGAWKNVADKNR